MFDEKVAAKFGRDIDALIEEIVDRAGQYDAHLSVLVAAAELIRDARLPWWRRGLGGWPIETYRGKPFKSALRIVLQNIRKLTG